jgi:hypothetical protein
MQKAAAFGSRLFMGKKVKPVQTAPVLLLVK